MQVLSSPFKVMKILSEYFGYTVPVCPIEGEKTSNQTFLAIFFWRPSSVGCWRAENLHFHNSKLNPLIIFDYDASIPESHISLICNSHFMAFGEIKYNDRFQNLHGMWWDFLVLSLVMKFQQCQWLGSSKQKCRQYLGISEKIASNWSTDM